MFTGKPSLKAEDGVLTSSFDWVSLVSANRMAAEDIVSVLVLLSCPLLANGPAIMVGRVPSYEGMEFTGSIFCFVEAH